MKYIDLGLPSGTLWCNTNSEGNNTYYFTFEQAMDFKEYLPTRSQWKELAENTEFYWNAKTRCIELTGPNGNKICLPASGKITPSAGLTLVGQMGYYWSYTTVGTLDGQSHAWNIHFGNTYMYTDATTPILASYKLCVRTVKSGSLKTNYATEDFVSPETAKILHDRGFDWSCIRSVIDNKGNILYPRPTLQMALKWVREVYNICIYCFPSNSKNYPKYEAAACYIDDGTAIMLGFSSFSLFADTHEQALESALWSVLTTDGLTIINN